MTKYKNKISILIPVFNNAESLEELTDRIFKVLEQMKDINFELIFVDDGSSDSSYNVLRTIKKKTYTENSNINLIKLQKNYGANEAAKAGLSYCTGDAVIILPADLQGPPELIKELVNKWSNSLIKLIICIRKTRNDSYFKIFTAKISYFLIRKLINKDYPKNGFDIFIADRKVYTILKNSPKFIHIPFLLFSLGFKYNELLFDRVDRKKGKSSWSIVKMADLVISIFVLNSFKLVRLITLIGLFITILSIVYSLVIFFNVFLNDQKTNGFATIVMLISFFGGITVLILGIITEQLIRLIKRSDGNPESIVESEDLTINKQN
jgi:glycosyltransferase involved in cell wall biosynthesis